MPSTARPAQEDSRPVPVTPSVGFGSTFVEGSGQAPALKVGGYGSVEG